MTSTSTRAVLATTAMATLLIVAGFPAQHRAAAQEGGYWAFARSETVKPGPEALGKNCRFGGNTGESFGAIGARFETTCYSPTLNVTTVSSGNADWHVRTVFEKAPGEFNANLVILIPGRLIGFSINAGSTSTNKIHAWVAMSNTHPRSGSVRVASTPVGGPGASVSGSGYAKVSGKPFLLPNGETPMLVLTYVVTGGSPATGITRHDYYRWDDGKGGPGPAAAPAPKPSPAGTPASSPDATAKAPARPPAPSQPVSGAAANYLGCFKDDRWNRDLSGFTFNQADMTTSLCQRTCREKGFAYGATQYSTHCFCGNAYGKHGRGESCNMPCGGNKSEMCGGYSLNSVYDLRR